MTITFPIYQCEIEAALAPRISEESEKSRPGPFVGELPVEPGLGKRPKTAGFPAAHPQGLDPWGLRVPTHRCRPAQAKSLTSVRAANKDRRINKCRLVAFRSAKGDTCFRADPKQSGNR